jgi:hypothetical protein
MTLQTPTASTFREAMLRSLGTATSLQANTPVRMKVILPMVYTDSGIAEDAYGNDNQDCSRVRMWVQQCYKVLRRQKLALKAGRGQWVLSEEGVKVAATLLGVPVPVQLLPGSDLTPVPVVAPTPVPTAEDIDLDDLLEGFTSTNAPADLDPGTNDAQDAPEASAAPEVDLTPAPVAVEAYEGVGGVAYTLGAQVNTYNPDPYIRGIAIEATACFGAYSNRSDVCKGCPLSGACKATVLTKLSEISARLHKRDAEAARRATMPPAPPAPTPAAEEDIDDIIAAIEDEVDAPKSAGKGVKMKVPADGKCRECKGKIERGTEAMYIRGTGIYHIKCYDKK